MSLLTPLTGRDAVRNLMIILVPLLALTLAAGAGHGKKPESRLDPETQAMLTRLCRQPELMNLDYLQYMIGRPENERTQRARRYKEYHWYDQARRLKYELHQSEVAPGQVVEARFIEHISDAPPTLSDVQAFFGLDSKPFYDYRSQATIVYTTAPNTQLAFHCPSNTFRVNEARINYRGPVLPSPSVVDLDTARSYRSARVSDLAGQSKHEEAAPMLRARLREHPEDGEAHYQLGRIYAQQGHINDAIGQYRAALGTLPPPGSADRPVGTGDSTAGGAATPPGGPQASTSEDLRGRCVAGLEELGVKPMTAEEMADRRGVKRDIRLIHKGQHMRAGGFAGQEKQDQKQQGKGQKTKQTPSGQPLPQLEPGDLQPAP